MFGKTLVVKFFEEAGATIGEQAAGTAVQAATQTAASRIAGMVTTRNAAIAGGILGCGLVGYFGYKWLANRKEEGDKK